MATKKASKTRTRAGRGEPPLSNGWEGWDDYAPFYDWENAQTLDRSDIRFWENMARKTEGPILELGCGTGRISIPVARTGAHIVGVDRSSEMLAQGRRREKRSRSKKRVRWVRADIRYLPFGGTRKFSLVMAPYGILQSLVRESDLTDTLRSVAGVLAKRGLFGIDLVPDLPVWKEYQGRTRFRGARAGGKSRITLIESVRQDPARGLTFFDQEFVERRGTERKTRKFSLTFRTLTIPQMVQRLERAGFEIRAVLGDYDGKPWDSRADVWLILASCCRISR